MPGGFPTVQPLSGGYRTSMALQKTALPPGHRLREQAEDLPDHERGVAANSEGRRDFDNVVARPGRARKPLPRLHLATHITN